MLPFLGALSTDTLPPWAWTMCLTIASPRTGFPQLPTSCPVHTVKPLKEPWQMLLVNALALVHYADNDFIILLGGLDFDPTLDITILDGILKPFNHERFSTIKYVFLSLVGITVPSTRISQRFSQTDANVFFHTISSPIIAF
jgi:hypothetical protein